MYRAILNLLWHIANLISLGLLGRRQQRRTSAALAPLLPAYQQLVGRRTFRRALHRATIWQFLANHPPAQSLPRRTRRQAMRNAAHHAFRLERELPEPYSRQQGRRLRRGYIDPLRLLVKPAAA